MASTMQQSDDDFDDGDAREDEFTLLALLARRVRFPRFSAREALGSVVLQLGHFAYVYVASVLSLFAVVVPYLAAISQRFDALGNLAQPEWMQRLVYRMYSRWHATSASLQRSLQYETLAGQLYDSASAGNRAITQAELYAMCLKLYCSVTRYAPQVLTPPSREQTDALFDIFDLDKSLVLDREEFVMLAATLYEMLAIRLGAQSLITLVLAPLGALTTVSFLQACMVPFPHEQAAAANEVGRGRKVPPTGNGTAVAGNNRTLGHAAYDALPEALQPHLGHPGVATAALTAVLCALLVPATLSLIDEYYLLRGARRVARSLKKARRRRSTIVASQLQAAPATTDGYGHAIVLHAKGLKDYTLSLLPNKGVPPSLEAMRRTADDVVTRSLVKLAGLAGAVVGLAQKRWKCD